MKLEHISSVHSFGKVIVMCDFFCFLAIHPNILVVHKSVGEYMGLIYYANR
jgi:hypothetical protein